VDLWALRRAGLVNQRLDGVRLLARGELKSALAIAVDSASRAAIAAVEQAGGSLTLSEPREPAEAPPASEPAAEPASE
jgi:large subunit ribosomal protein L15